MTAVENQVRRPRGTASRRLLWVTGIAIGLFALYAAAGFALAPWLVKTHLPDISQREFGHRVTVGALRFNPFRLHVEAADLRLAEPDGKQMIGLGTLAIDLEWSSLWRRTWHLALVRLDAPRLILAIAPDGRFNLAQLIAALNRDPPKEKQPLPRVSIDRFELNAGRVDIDDRRAGYSNSFTPIEFAISDLSTLPDHNGPYTLSAASARGGAIRWKGEASLNPIAGRGQLLLEAISLPELAKYVKPFAEVTLASGKFGATLPYKFAYADGKFAFEVEKAALKLSELNLRVGGAGAPEVMLSALDIDAIDASLTKREFAVAGIKLAGLAVRPDGAKELALALPSVVIGPIAGNAASGDLAVESIALADVAVRSPLGKDAALKLAAFRIGRVAGNMTRGEWVVESVGLVGGNLALRRDARGQIDLLSVLTPGKSLATVTPPVAGSGPAPAASPWQVVVKRFTLDDFGLIYADLTTPKPLQLDIGRVALKLALEASQAAGGLKVLVSDAELAVTGVTANDKSDAPLRLGEIGIAGARFDLAANSLLAERAWLKGAELKLLLDAAGRLNLLDLVPGAGVTSAASTAGARAAAAPFKVGIKTVDIGGVSADFEDKGSGIRLRAQEAGARLVGVSSNMADPLMFEAALKLREGGAVRAKGRVVPAFGMVDTALRVDDLALAPMQPLLARWVKLTLARGAFNADGRLQVGVKGAPRLRYAGALGLSDLLLAEDGGKQFAALKGAAAEGVILELGPDTLEVPELRLDGLQAQLLIEADRSLNATRLLVQAPAREGTAAPAPGATGANAGAPPVAGSAAPPAAGPAPPLPAAGPAPPLPGAAAGVPADPFPVTLRRLRVVNAKLDFEDLSLRPQFGAKIHELNGVITGLSTNPVARSKLELDGRVDEFGLARIRGELNPFFPRNNTDVGVIFRNIDMTTATPYAMKFAGYKIAAGKISLDLNYKVRNSQLEGDNQVVIEQLTLGERVDSPDALKLPLELAIAILKDSDGRIDLGLPISGSLDDPQFSYGAIVWKALVNVLTRIVTAPFRALGALFGGDGAKLESIDFDPGSAAILPPEREKLRQVAQVLGKRAQLNLAVPGQYSEEADAPVLREKAMRREILVRAGVKLAPAEEPGPLDIADRAQRAALRDVFGARHGAPALEQLRVGADAGTLASQAVPGAAKNEPVPVWRRAINLAQGEPSVSDPGAFYNAISARLAASQPLAPDALQTLAGERSGAIAAALKDAGIDPARVSRPTPEKTEARGKVVPLKLGLGSR